jgi:hypothetical protein
MDSINSTAVTLKTLTGDPLIEEARDQFDRCIEWESTYRKKFLEDIKFANADSYNGYQWPDDIRHTRDLSDRPCLTLNIVRQHNLMISNAASQNKVNARILGMGNGATQESANVVKAIIKHIEHVSGAQKSAYSIGRRYQIDGGIGWWRIITDYESNDTFNQEIYIKPINDPLAVYMDPDIQEPDGSDAKFAFVFDFLPDDQVRKLVPDWSVDGPPKTPLGLASGESFWIEKDHTMVCEWFRKVPKEDRLLSFVNERGMRVEIRESKLPANAVGELLDRPDTITRRVVDWKIEWKLIVGEQIVQETDWMGAYIPLIRVIGEEYVIEGILDRKGHTRAMQDAQRMYNYNASGQVEFGALQSKTPWLAPAKAIEEQESMWNTANTENHSVLIWNHVADDGSDVPIPPPIRVDPPQVSPLYESGMQTAMQQMMMVSGQWQNQMGMLGNERTGKAIQERMEAGDTATFHYQENYETALVFTYKQIIDLFPKIYDTKRVKHILNDDGIELDVVIDPGSRQAYQERLNHNNLVIERIFNPQLGQYDILPEVGPATSTRRQETVEALTLILTQAPGLTGIIGDLLLKSMDFEAAQEAALRLKRMVPQVALGEGPTPNEQKLQQQVGQLTTTLSEAMQRHGKDALKLVGKDQMRDIDAYKAETDRIKALAPLLPTDQQGLQQLIEQLVGDALKTHLTPIIEANMEGVEDQGSNGSGSGASGGGGFPGAQQAPDGGYYVLDPTRRSRYLRVEPLVKEATSGR